MLNKLLLLLGAIIILAVGAGAFFMANQLRQEPVTPLPTSQREAAPTPATPSAPAAITETYVGDLTGKIDTKVVKLSGVGTQGLDIDPETGLVYVANNGSVVSKCDQGGVQGSGRDTISVIDPVKAVEVANEKTDGAPIWPLVDTKRNVVYFSASGASTVVWHERGTGKKLSSLKVGGLPHAFGLFENLMVVSNTNDQSQTYYAVVDVDKKTVVAHHKSPHLPHPIVVDPEKKIAYIMGVEDGTTMVIDMTTGESKETFKFEGGGGQMIMSKKLGKAFTDFREQGKSAAAYDLETKKLLGSIAFNEVNAPGTGLAVDEEVGLLFVVIGDKDAVGVANAKTLKPLGFLKAEGCPYGVKVDTARGKGFVTSSGKVTMFDLTKLRAALAE